jgi:hypothetical protein
MAGWAPNLVQLREEPGRSVPAERELELAIGANHSHSKALPTQPPQVEFYVHLPLAMWEECVEIAEAGWPASSN